MRVALIYVRDPQFYAIQAGDRGPTGNPRVMGFPPIGIMCLSAVLKRAGHECLMFDQSNPDETDDQIIDSVREFDPDLIGLSFLSTTSYPYAKMLARKIRAAGLKTKLALGGVFATLNAQRVKKQCSYVDFVCRGDGEQMILDLLDNLETPDDVVGLTWEKDGEIIHNSDRKLDRDLDQWPFPDRETLAIDFIESMPLDVPVVLSRDKFTTMQTSRGCPWPCVFCDIPIFSEGKWRFRSAAHVVKELKHLEALGYKAVSFVDDHFLLQPKRIEAICNGILDAGLKIKWGAEGRVDTVGRPLFPLMAKANCRTLMFGLESGSQKVLDRLKKEQTLEQGEDAIRDAKKAGIELVHGFFIVGCPDETAEDMKATMRFASKIPLDTFGFNRLCVYRGTPLWNEYVSRGLVDDEKDWYKYYKCSEIDPTCLSGQEINKIRANGLKRLFLSKLFWHPIQTMRLLRRLARHMPLRDIGHLLIKPFLGNKSGATKAEELSRAVEHGEMKDAAAKLTQVEDSELEAASHK